jgi:hypothetical protein
VQQRCASPQSRHRLISNALTSQPKPTRCGAVKRRRYRPHRIELRGNGGGGRKKKRENRVEGRESPCACDPLFSFAIKRKLARKEKRRDARAGYRAGFSLKVNLCRAARSVFDLSRDCSIRCADRSDSSHRKLIFLENTTGFYKILKRRCPKIIRAFYTP